MSNVGEDATQKPQDQAAPPTEAPPASETKKTESQGGLKEVGLEELLERAKMDAPASEAASKPEQAENPKAEAPKSEAGRDDDLSILEKARQLLEQEGQGKALDENANVSRDLQQDAAGGQEPEQDKTATQIGDTPVAEKAADVEKKEAAEAKDEGKQGPGDNVQPTEVAAAEEGADAKAKE